MKNRNIALGYRYEVGKIVVDQREYQIVHSIFSQYLAGASMLQIANILTGDRIEFSKGNNTWNKARIMRIISDERYLGNDIYPRIISDEVFEQAQSIKNGRNTQTKTNRCAGVYQLKVPVICPCCGCEMKRYHDARNARKQKWVCKNTMCEARIFKDDSDLTEDICGILNTLIANPSMIRYREKPYEPSNELRRVDNAIARLTGAAEISKSEGMQDILFRRFELAYSEIDSTKYITEELIEMFTEAEHLECFSHELTNKAVKSILMHPDGKTSIVLMNDQTINAGGKK